MESPYTILLALQLSVNTLWFMLVVLPRSIQLHHLTKCVSLVVESPQVRIMFQELDYLAWNAFFRLSTDKCVSIVKVLVRHWMLRNLVRDHLWLFLVWELLALLWVLLSEPPNFLFVIICSDNDWIHLYLCPLIISGCWRCKNCWCFKDNWCRFESTAFRRRWGLKSEFVLLGNE